jgi:hypothetical protein
MKKANTVNSRTRTHVLSLCGVGALSLVVTACDQPKPKCNIARGNFAAHYTLVSGEGPCAELTGEDLGIGGYNPPISKSDQRPDYKRVSVGIQPVGLSNYLWAGIGAANPEDSQAALGEMTDSEAKDDFCVVPTLSPARLRMDAVEEAPNEDMCMPPYPGQEAVDITYEFSNVRVYNTPANMGTSFAADLTYTNQGCVAKYKVTAVYPSVSCALELPPVETTTDENAVTGEALDGSVASDDAGESADGGVTADGGEVEADGGCPPAEEEEVPPMGEIVPDDTLCDAVPDQSKGREVGSMISPDYATFCSPDTLTCVLKSDPPSLR